MPDLGLFGEQMQRLYLRLCAGVSPRWQDALGSLLVRTLT
jgi:hypothetical protein